MAQVRYNMSNRTVDDCIGILVDSETGNNDFPTGYFHNENYVFTICVPGSPGIELAFSFFQTEECCDIMTIYDGPDPSSPIIGTYSGDNSPGTITSSGECITIAWRTDGNITAEGWVAEWTAVPPEPEAPTIAPVPNVTCESTTVEIEFDMPVPCTQLSPENFEFNGPAGGAISAVTPINCDAEQKTTRARLTFTSPLNESGTYCFVFDFVFIDNCNRSFPYELPQCFNIIDCPLEVYIEGDTNICSNGCGEITAVVSGGNPANYQYAWTPNAPNAATITVCPDAPITYSVTVTDGASIPASATFDIDTLPPPTAQQDTALCRYANEFFLDASPNGGFWYGRGTNGQGRFRPQNAGPGLHPIVYVAPNGCVDTTLIDVWDVRADNPRAACVGAPPFTMNGQAPGGTWSGPNITPDGTFTPPNVADTIIVEYTEPVYGCVAQQQVVIVDSIQLPALDSIAVCTNQSGFNMNDLTRPERGGRWSGQGINGGGWFNPSAVGEGTFVVYCALEGCQDSTNITVSAIEAGNDTLSCPNGQPFDLLQGTPAGGVWRGPGVTDNGDGTYTFDPGFNQKDSVFYITYDLTSCADSLIVYNISTQISPEQDTLSFCEGDDIVVLDTSFTQPNLYDTTLSRLFGPGIVGKDSLDPSLLPIGVTYIYYEFFSNGCYDSLAIEIRPNPVVTNDTIRTCLEGDPIPLSAFPAGGVWSGYGVDTDNNLFLPDSVGFLGDWPATYTYNGCSSQTIIRIETISPTVRGIPSYFCLANQPVQLDGIPVGGVYSGSGVSPTGIFNPMDAGAGTHEIVYAVGTEPCIFYDTFNLRVLDSISLSLSSDWNFGETLCYGDSIYVTVNKSGGLFTADFSYTWSADTLRDTNYVNVKPFSDTTYTVIVDDGCSEPEQISFSLSVHPEITYDIFLGDTVCYGDTNWARIEMTSGSIDEYQLRWNTPTPSGNDSVSTIAGKYDLDITALATNCTVTETVRIPHYPYLKARYSRDPADGEELDVRDPVVRLIDQSTGADWGYWIFGDETEPLWFENTLNWVHLYPDSGIYELKLIVYNEALCVDSISTFVIVNPIKAMFLPNAFTPNGDGDNDTWPAMDLDGGDFLPTGYGLHSYEMTIFDRWGHIVYESGTNGPPWNGRILNIGNMLTPDVYVYHMIYRYNSVDVRETRGSVTLVR